MRKAKPLRTFKSVTYLQAIGGNGKPLTFEYRDLIADMLRYDVAWVSERHPGIIAFITFAVRGSGIFKANPTVRRWESFGVSLRRIPKEECPVLDTARDVWVSYRHPKGNYSFEQVTMTDFFKEESE